MAGRIGLLAESLHDASVDDIQKHDLTSMWQETCATLGCDAESWQDIEDALYDHTAALVENNAPIVAIHHHIQARGRARRAYMKIASSKAALQLLQSSQAQTQNHSATVVGPIAFMTAQSARAGAGARRYDPAFRHGSRVLHAVETMLVIAAEQGVALTSTSEVETVEDTSKVDSGWGGRRRRRRRRDRRRRRRRDRRRRGGWWGSVTRAVSSVATAVVHVAKVVVTAVVDTFSCMGISVGQSVGYERTFPPITSLALKVTMEDSIGIATWAAGHTFAVCTTFKVHATVGVGVGSKAPVGCSIGVSFGLQAVFDSCGNVQFDVSVGVGGACSWPAFVCPLIPILAAFECKQEVGVGLTVMCGKFNLKTGQYVAR